MMTKFEIMQCEVQSETNVRWLWMDTPIGPVLLRSHGSKASGIYLQHQQYFPAESPSFSVQSNKQDESGVLLGLKTELREYFAGSRRQFETDFCLVGTDFQCEVWSQLQKIPFGGKVTYGEIAASIGRSNASRAVGAAIGKNPLSILLPCHRVIGKSGGLTGYAGGLDRKRWLLDFEYRCLVDTDVQQQLMFA